jgi:histidinol-phosphate/aromatic aminotransferase/cobyric acid decarboxylase-like protein
MMSSNYKPEKILVDKGFDADFSWDRINELCKLFSDDDLLQSYVYKMHEHDKALDLKRGEFYPELLRSIISIKRSVSSLYGIDVTQVQPNFGSNGSIDTILSAVKVEESKRLNQWANTMTQRLHNTVSTFRNKTSSESTFAELETLLQQEQRQGGALFTSPTYFRNYNSASAKNLTVNLVPLTESYQIDTQAFVDVMLQSKPSIVFLVTPNNPTGLPIPDHDLLCILDKLPQDSWALIDRTLVNTKPEISSRDLLHRYADKNVVILHSFSKYRGMSHHRIGVALYSNPVMANVVQPHLPLGIGLEGCLKANRIVLQDGGIFPSEHIISNIKENNALLRSFVTDFPDFDFTDFSGNYCLVMLPRLLSSQNACNLLYQRGLYVMGGHEFPEPNQSLLRLHTGGPPKYIKLFCRIISKMAGDS